MPVQKTFCSICNPHSHCGINALVEGGHLIEVEGMPEHPANQGTLCAKGAASLQYVYLCGGVQGPTLNLKRLSFGEAYTH